VLDPCSSVTMRVGISVILVASASACCLSIDSEIPDGSDIGGVSAGLATGGNTSNGGTGNSGSSGGGAGSTSGRGAADAGPCAETCSFPTAQTVTCTGSVLWFSATVGRELEIKIGASCMSSTVITWGMPPGSSLPPGLSFDQPGSPAVAHIHGVLSGTPDPNPFVIRLQVDDHEGDLGHLKILLTVNQ